MSPRVAIAGSGIVAAALAYHLTRRGFDVDVFEKGGAYPYPHAPQFVERVQALRDLTRYQPPDDLRLLECEGDYSRALNEERVFWQGGMATMWEAITLRMRPRDFRPGPIFGDRLDWPLDYAEIEPYYGQAERLLGVSGTDADNPFAPPRSQPFPLPPFELAADDLLLQEQLKAGGITLHTTPQARTRAPYDGRSACMNFGTCTTCPIGARYSPSHHLELARTTGRCRVYLDHSVRRVITHRGMARAFLVQETRSRWAREAPADVLIVAAGAIESARLLRLSRETQPDGLGNEAGQVGRHFMMHHIWRGDFEYGEPLFPGRFGGFTGQCQQFCDPPDRGRHGGVKVELSSQPSRFRLMGASIPGDATREQIVGELQRLSRTRLILLQAETIPSSGKRITLGSTTDRFGDPCARVEYTLVEFDSATYTYARTLFDRFRAATRAEDAWIEEQPLYNSGHHHMGGCRMGDAPEDSVVDRWCRVHGFPNLFVVGTANFVTCGSVNPTLTAVALALRCAGFISAQLGGR